MAENTNIEWCDHTFNPWIGCAKVSPGCAHCYAETQDKFRSWTPQGWGAGNPRVRTSEANWRLPLKWNRANDCGVHFGRQDMQNQFRRPRVFCASLADWLDDEVPVEWLVNLLETIHATPHLDWLLLTKRPQNFRSRMDGAFQFGELTCERHVEFINALGAWTQAERQHAIPWNNVWIGATVEDRARATPRIAELLKIPARIRFLSCEPLLEPLDIQFQISKFKPKVHWVICGGESGSGARPFHADWARSLRDQCRAAGVPFFMKQMGGTRKPFASIPEDLMIREFPFPTPKVP